MKNILDDKVMKQQENSNMEANALKAALQKLIDLPGGPLDDIPAPQQPQQIAQVQPTPNQVPVPEEGQQPPAEQPTPTEQPQAPQQQGGIFGGFRTRQEQLDDEIRKQTGQ